MIDPPITKLRRARARVHRVLDRLEPLVAGYREKLARLEAEIKAIAPELDLPHRRREPNPDFARGELPRIAMDILRMAAGPMAMRDIATKALARKGITLPDRRTMKRTRLALQKVFAIWAKRGVVVGVGIGNGRKRMLDINAPTSRHSCIVGKFPMYIPAPDELPGFPDAGKVRPKSGRTRWRDSKNSHIYEWDRRHGTIEVYSARGDHLGEYDHVTGERLKGADKTRRTEP